VIDSLRLRVSMLCTAIAGGVMACATQQESARNTSAGGAAPMMMDVGGHRIEIAKPALAFPKNSGRMPAWVGYALARRMWVDLRFHQQFPAETTYRYSFEEELEARQIASKSWAAFDAQKQFTDRYFGDLHQIDNAGFLREYVWYCVPHPAWKQPAALRQAAFSAWMSAQLPEHQVETWVAVVPAGIGQRVILGVQPHRAVKCQVAPPDQPPPGPASMAPPPGTEEQTQLR
jgi:hypothetical protein